MFSVTHQNLALCYENKDVVTKIAILNQQEYQSGAKLLETSKYFIAAKRREETEKRKIATFESEEEKAASRVDRSNLRWGRN